MTTQVNGSGAVGRRLAPSDVTSVSFTRASMLRPGYVDTEVDHFLSRLAEEMGRLIAEKAQLRDQVNALQRQLKGVTAQPPPSEQAVRILATAQQTADNYVAEAEEFSRQMTSEARAQYEDQVRLARENAGAIIQAAQEAAAKLATGGAPAVTDAGHRSVEELEAQVNYLKAFAQACRVQLRAYLEALLADVEQEWGRADPTALPQQPIRAHAQRSDERPEGTTQFLGNTAAETPRSDAARDVVPARAGATSS
jgi:DivIVA domain-containing protein